MKGELPQHELPPSELPEGEILEARRGNAMFWVPMVVVLAVLVVGVALSRRFGSDPSITASPLIGKPLPEVALPYLDRSGSLTIRALSPPDILVVNFWASWCFGCRQEHAALISAAEIYESAGVSFVGVNYQDHSIDRSISFLDELGRSKATHYVRDEASRTALEFGVLGLPETFFVDRAGFIVGKVSGPVTSDLLNATIEKILLGQSVGQVNTGEVENLSG
jgi:cytochrome c biogenesis protein CcmG/thiol:disulfide interchange protein DsbE